MKITKTPNIKAKAKAIDKAINKGLSLSGYGAINSMKKRIKKGTNADGGSFKKLNKAYQSYKKDLGKKAMFELSGDMLRSITFETKKKSDDNILRIKFDDDDMRKRAKYNYLNGRKFFELSDKEEKKIHSNVKKEISKVL